MNLGDLTKQDKLLVLKQTNKRQKKKVCNQPEETNITA